MVTGVRRSGWILDLSFKPARFYDVERNGGGKAITMDFGLSYEKMELKCIDGNREVAG